MLAKYKRNPKCFYFSLSLVTKFWLNSLMDESQATYLKNLPPPQNFLKKILNVTCSVDRVKISPIFDQKFDFFFSSLKLTNFAIFWESLISPNFGYHKNEKKEKDAHTLGHVK